jgi:hypothetical protein
MLRQAVEWFRLSSSVKRIESVYNTTLGPLILTPPGEFPLIDDTNPRLDEQEERRRNDRSRLIVDVFFDGKDATGVASTKDIGVGVRFQPLSEEARALLQNELEEV